MGNNIFCHRHDAFEQRPVYPRREHDKLFVSTLDRPKPKSPRTRPLSTAIAGLSDGLLSTIRKRTKPSTSPSQKRGRPYSFHGCTIFQCDGYDTLKRKLTLSLRYFLCQISVFSANRKTFLLNRYVNALKYVTCAIYACYNKLVIQKRLIKAREVKSDYFAKKLNNCVNN